MSLQEYLDKVEEIMTERTNGLVSDEECANKLFTVMIERVNTVEKERKSGL